MKFSLRLSIAACFVSQVFADAMRRDLEIYNKVIAPDGFERSAVLAEGTMPGPPITGKKGDTFRINVIDSLTDPTMHRTTSIHWHGIHQRRSAWADGTIGATQCPIVAGNSFEYQFDVPDQTGTFWYHSHLADQLCDGLRGAFIIYDPADPFREMYHLPSPQIPNNRGPLANSTLINGKGRYATGPPVPLAVIRVQQGKRYRFRLLNTACDPFYTWTIEGHRMTIIEADGVDSQPHEVDQLDIHAGQRYSFVLHANQPIDNYWIRARPNKGVDTSFTNNQHSAILRYEGAPDADPIDRNRTAQNPLRESALRPLADGPPVPGQPFPGGADVNINMVMGFDSTDFQFSLNGVKFVPPNVPVLLQILSGAKTPQELLPQGSVYQLPLNKVIEISIPARPDGTAPGQVPGGPHPFHLHGHDFYVVRSAGNSSYNYVNPMRRDTVDTGFLGDNTTIRFVTDNDGPWLLHCHIDFHITNGLAVVLAEANQQVQPLRENIPEEWARLCPIYETLGLANPNQLDSNFTLASSGASATSFSSLGGQLASTSLGGGGGAQPTSGADRGSEDGDGDRQSGRGDVSSGRAQPTSGADGDSEDGNHAGAGGNGRGSSDTRGGTADSPPSRG